MRPPNPPGATLPTDPPTTPPPRANLIVLPAAARRGRVVGTLTSPSGERIPVRESFADGGDLEAELPPVVTSVKVGGVELLADTTRGSTFTSPVTDLHGQAGELVDNIALLVRTRAAAWLR